MHFSRRETLGLTAAMTCAVILPLPASALQPQTIEAIDAFTARRPISQGGIDLIVEEFIEDGGKVPIEIRCRGARSIMLISDINPYVEIARFHFGPLSANQRVETNIRLAGSQQIVVLAEMQDDTVRQVSKQVMVTLGGCW